MDEITKRSILVLELTKMETTLMQLVQMFAVTPEERLALRDLSVKIDELSRQIANRMEMSK